MLVWCTGLPGAGKSTACRALHAEGVLTLDADDAGLAGRRWRHDHRPVPGDVPLDWTTQEWALDRAGVEHLRAGLEGPCVLFGFVENWGEVRALFDAVAFLDVPAHELVRRLAVRTDNHYGERPDELAAVRRWAATEPAAYTCGGAVLIDGRADPASVAGRLLSLLAAESRPGDR